MCGITGFWTFRHTPSQDMLPRIDAMTDRLAQRGPDGRGVWCDETSGLAFGHRRLKIVDLSEHGHQPMVSRSGRYVLSYNGELYNATELRKSLETYTTFHGTSDTEVLLEAIALWGVEEACRRILGMFAFSVFDKQKRKLFLVRDRLGVKPLYWGFHKGVLFFGSQPKSFFGYPGFDPALDPVAIEGFFHYNYVPSPLSIFQGISKAKPGTIIAIDGPESVQTLSYWDPVALTTEPLTQSEETLTRELKVGLCDAVKRRMVADVPLGAFLSGGIDSSLVVALMQEASARPIETFSIGFHEKEYNEAPYAEAVASHLGTHHHTLYVTDKEACSVIQKLPEFYDEPFADSSQIPTYLLSRFARQHVTVALSGDGGDELFAGYTRYIMTARLYAFLGRFPKGVRLWMGHVLQGLPEAFWDGLALCLPKALSKIRSVGKYCLLSPDILYDTLVSFWDKAPVLKPSPFVKHVLYERLKTTQTMIQDMQLLDLVTYLPDDILVKVDRASMAVGLEVRGPLLDHRLVEFAMRLPLSMRVRGGQGKILLRNILSAYVPHALTDRPKMGFGIPLTQWLKGPLKDFAHDHMSLASLKAGGILDAPRIHHLWKAFLAGRPNLQHAMWSVLMFQTWAQTYAAPCATQEPLGTI